MRSAKNVLLLTLTIALLVFSSACGQSGTEPNKVQEAVTQENGAKSVNITVSAAASLKDAMEEIKTAYANGKSNVIITYNFGSSGSLQQQIEQGAEVDIFISAAAKQMNALRDKGLVLDDTRKNLLGNRLVLIIPRKSSTVSDFTDLTGEKVKQIALGEPKSVPAGQYAEEVFTKLNILDKLKSKAIYGKDVKEVLTWVETGNADTGVVYETDAKTSDKVRIAAVASEDSHKPIVYPSAVLKESKNIDAAKDFINYLYSEKAKPVFEKYGFKFIAE